MQTTITIPTTSREGLYDITDKVHQAVQRSNANNGLVNLYVQGATAGIMIQENWDDSVQQDVIDYLARSIPRGVWRHDQQDGNGDAHIKAGMVGPSETIPLVKGKMGLSQWQNIFVCEFDGPRTERRIICTILEDNQ